MFYRLCKILPLCLIIFFSGDALGWELESGQQVRGKAVSFDYREKSLGIEDAVTGKVSQIPAKNLSLRSRQLLLFLPVFHEAFPEEDGWPEEKYYLLRLAILSPVAALLIGFWVGGILITRKFNPLRAVLGFFGSWIIGGLFIFFYLYFAGRFGGGTGTVLFGALLGTVFLSVFISAVYLCSIWKGFLIFFSQVFAALFISIIGIGLATFFISIEKREEFWNEHVFEPVGMLNPTPLSSQNRTP